MPVGIVITLFCCKKMQHETRRFICIIFSSYIVKYAIYFPQSTLYAYLLKVQLQEVGELKHVIHCKKTFVKSTENLITFPVNNVLK